MRPPRKFSGFNRFAAGVLFAGLMVSACSGQSALSSEDENIDPDALIGCDGQAYPDPATSPYVIPFPPGTIIETGLGNCSSSYHGAEYPDRYATDFNAVEGTPFMAARAGTVTSVVENQPSVGGGSGNHVLVEHADGSQAYYLHSPKDGIMVEVGDHVEPGDTLGVVGQSGLAGYPHLHFVVVVGDPAWPYTAIPVTFRNVNPRDVALKTYTEYEVLAY